MTSGPFICTYETFIDIDIKYSGYTLEDRTLQNEIFTEYCPSIFGIFVCIQFQTDLVYFVHLSLECFVCIQFQTDLLYFEWIGWINQS